MPKLRSISDLQLRYAVTEVESVRSLFRNLNVALSGSNYQMLWERIRSLGLDVSHWTGQAHLRGKHHNWNPRQPLEKVLCVDSSYPRGCLKSRLIEEGLLPNKCSNPKCGVSTDWLGDPLMLVLDHINGIHNDNRLGNLRLLCPNCNSQTPTFSGRNIHRETHPGCLCTDCSIPISRGATRCKRCTGKLSPTKIQWPSNADLIHRVDISSYSAVARDLGVSDNAIRKRLARNSSTN